VELVTVAEFFSVTEATLSKDFLEEHGIKACLGGSRPQNPGAEGVPMGCIVQVQEADARRATEILRAVKRQRASVAERSAKPTPKWMVTVITLLFAVIFISIILALLSHL
jgi:hypothetical protein